MQVHSDIYLSLIVLFLLIMTLNIVACQYEFNMYVDLAHYTCPVERKLFDVDAQSETVCALKCGFEDMCFGISYQRSRQHCIGCAPYNCSSTVAFDQAQDTEFYVVKNKYLVSGVRPVFDHYLTASSVFDFDNSISDAISARMCTVPSETSVGCWVAAYRQQGEWVQAHLWKTSKIVRVATAGRNNYDFDQYVKAYKFLYSTDCSTFETVNNSTGNPMIFPGNTDRYTIVYNDLPTPVDALCVRISPTEWHNYISLRFDVIGYEI